MKVTEETISIEIKKPLADQIVDLTKQGAFGSGYASMDLDSSEGLSRLVERFLVARLKSGRTTLKRKKDERDLEDRYKRLKKMESTIKKVMSTDKGGD